MKRKNKKRWVKLTLTGILIFILGCGLFENPDPDATPIYTATPTNTPESGRFSITPTTHNRCEGISGWLEMQVLAGPAEAVGLESYAVGNIPFSVMKDGQTHTIQGGGDISYQQILEEAWGTYTVSLDMTANITGECSGESESEILNMTVEASGEQIVEVRAEGFSGDYPWSGTHKLDLIFPLEEGASAEGEGWAFILHLNE